MKIEIRETTAIVSAKVKKNQAEKVQTDCQFTFDMSTFTMEEILEQAVRNLTIKAQALWRADKIENVATLTKESFKIRKPSKSNKLTALEYVKGELAKGRTMDEIMEELNVQEDSE